MRLVIDTNVLEHASNQIEARQQDSIDLLTRLQDDRQSVLYVDEEIDFDKSIILNEYRERLVPGNFGHTILLLLINQQRILPIPRVVKKPVSKNIREYVHDRSDIIFVKVSYNSPEKLLVSHDFTHMSKKARSNIFKTIAVNIMTAGECIY